MKNVRIYSLFSSSRGNCHYLRLGDRHILVDAGKNAKTIKNTLESIGVDLKKVDRVFVTHEHNDHTSAVRVLQKKYDMTFFVPDMCEHSRQKCELCDERIVRVASGESYEDEKVTVRAFAVPHDAEECFGYRIEYRDGEECFSVGIATDIGHLTNEVASGLFGCDAVIVEANHDTKMLIEGPYPDSLKARVLSAVGHLSNDSCSRLCDYLAKNGTKYILLAHLSEENNTPELALSSIRAGVCTDGVEIKTASADYPVCLCEF